jgi:aminopeptidase N
VRAVCAQTVSLTKAEAESRALLISDCTYDVELDFAMAPDTYGYSVKLAFQGTPGGDTFIDAQVDRIDHILWQGSPIGRDAHVGQRILLPRLEHQNRLEVSGHSAYDRAGVGLRLAIDPSDQERYLYTDLEPAEAHRVFPCFDQPDLKGRFSLKVRAPHDWTVVAAVEGVSGPAIDANGARWWSFPSSPPLSPYVLGIAAGRLHVVRQQHGEIPLALYAPRSLAQDLEEAAPEIFEVTRQGLSFYQKIFGIPYPFPKYDHVFCLENVSEAMESPGCVTMTDRMIYRGRPSARERSQRAELILHEMAHMWFGDLVSPRWWDDLWLNESFATFMAAVAEDRATGFDDAWTYWATAFRQEAVAEDQRSTSHPVVAAVPDVESAQLNFDRITYQKGAAVLRQLAAWVGEKPFFAALHNHLQDHREGNASFLDLVGALELSSGRDVTAWARAWLQTVGINTLHCKVENSPAGTRDQIQSVQVVQSASQRQPTLRPHRIGLGLYDWREGRIELARRLEVDLDQAVTEVPGVAGTPRPALLLPNDGALSYAKVRLDPISQLTVETHLGEISDGLARAVLWDWAWDMVRDAEMPARRYLELVVAHLPCEVDHALIPVVLRNSRTALSTYFDPGASEGPETILSAVVQGALGSAAPASSAQLAWLQAFIACATTPEQIELCRDMLSGGRLPVGIVLTLELRWRLVTALAARGAVGEDALADMLRRDATTTGQVRALAARAAMPLAGKKEEVFLFLTEDPSATVEDVMWAGPSFAGRHRDDLLSPYIPRFFVAVDNLQASRGTAYSRNFANWFLTSLPPVEPLIVALEEQLSRFDLNNGVRRIYQDGLEETQRSIKARDIDTLASIGSPAQGE